MKWHVVVTLTNAQVLHFDDAVKHRGNATRYVVFDENDKPIEAKDTNGQPIPTVDENGEPTTVKGDLPADKVFGVAARPLHISTQETASAVSASA